MKKYFIILVVVLALIVPSLSACAPKSSPPPTTAKYTLSFDTCGGNESYDAIQLAAGAALSALPTPSRDDFKFLGWQDASGNEYTAESRMPEKNLLLFAQWERVIYVLSPDGRVYFGEYPQSLVSDDTLSAALTTAAGGAPTDGATEIWYDYDYYVAGKQTSFMYYADVEYGGEKYRGVYFSQYRPDLTNRNPSNAPYQQANGYVTGEVYWFKYETLVWKVMSSDDGYLLLMSEYAIDSQSFNVFANSTSKVYANNYKESSIRTFLNNTFYRTAFDNYDRTIITDTTVVNGADSTTREETNAHLCEDTVDKIWLPCDADIVNPDYGFNESYAAADNRRLKHPSDYSKCQGLYINSDRPDYAPYMLRSPDWYFDNFSFIVSSDGSADGRGYVNYTVYGIVPMLRIKTSEAKTEPEEQTPESPEVTAGSLTLGGYHDYQGTVSVEPQKESYSTGDKISLDISAKEHCKLKSVTVNGTDITSQKNEDGKFDIEISGVTDVQIKFTEDWTVVWHATVDDFDDQVDVEGKVFIDFYALWCEPCMEIVGPFVDRLVTEGKLKIIKIETSDKNKNPYPEEAIYDKCLQKCGLSSGALPFQILYENGKIKKHIIGAVWGGSSTYEAFVKWLGV